jgi:hypothetical protein
MAKRKTTNFRALLLVIRLVLNIYCEAAPSDGWQEEHSPNLEHTRGGEIELDLEKDSSPVCKIEDQ